MQKSATQKLSLLEQLGLILSISMAILLSKPAAAASPSSINKACEPQSLMAQEEIDELAVDFCKQLNRLRQKYNLPQLKINLGLNSVAQDHAEDMYERGYFSHSNPQGESAFDRLRADKISFQRAAENIAKGQKTNRAVLEAWMNSPGHRRNMLDARYGKFGIGMTNYNWVLDLTN